MRAKQTVPKGRYPISPCNAFACEAFLRLEPIARVARSYMT